MWRESGKRSPNVFINASDKCSSKSRRTNSSSWNAQRPSLAFGRVGQACPNVFATELWEIGQELLLRHSTRQVPENVAHGDAGPANTGLSEPDGRIDADAIQNAHGPSLRPQWAVRQTTVSLIVARLRWPIAALRSPAMVGGRTRAWCPQRLAVGLFLSREVSSDPPNTSDIATRSVHCTRDFGPADC
jgi:hypothetical protein